MPVDVLTATAVAGAILFLPGTLALIGARLPIPLLVAAAPAVTLFVADLGGRLAALAGLRWSVLWLLVPAVLLGIGLAGATRAASGPRGEPWWTAAGTAFVGVSVMAAAAFGISGYVDVSDGFSVIPQDFDPIFHANAIRWIAETGVATPSGLMGMDSVAQEPGGYYPMALHGLAALVYDYTGAGVVASYHATISVFMVILPLGAAALAGALRLGPVVAGGAALVSTSFTSLPWELLWRGLFPFGVTVVAATAVLALLAHGMATRHLAVAAAFACGSAGLVAAHTSAVATLGVLGLGIVLSGLISSEGRGAIGRWLAWMTVLLLAALLPTVFSLDADVVQAGSGTAGDWPAVQSMPEAIRSALGFGTGFRDTIQLRLAVAVWAGVLASLLPPFRRAWYLLPGLLAAMVLYVVAAAVDNDLSLRLTSFWWNDQLRLAALPAVVAPVFVGTVLGAVVWSLGMIWTGSGRPRPAAWWSGADAVGASARVGLSGLAAVVVALAAWTGGLSSARDRGMLAVTFMYFDGPAVSSGEASAMNHLGELIPECRDVQIRPECAVMNDPGDGSPWMFAISGVRPVFAHGFPPDPATDRGVLARRFDELGDDPDVRRIARTHNVEYAYTAEGFTLGQGPRVEGLDALDDRPDIFELLWSSESASLYRVRWDRLPPT